MKEDKRIIKSGPFKGKRIEFASTAGVDRFQTISEDFMRRIFNFEPGEYLITDESSLRDFTGLDEVELTDIQKRILDFYSLDVSDIGPGNLLEIFKRIHYHRSGSPFERRN
jgi:hypothetical protein